MLKEQMGQLCTSATFALKTVNATQSGKEKNPTFCPLYCKSVVAQMPLLLKEFSSDESQPRQTRAPHPPRIIWYTVPGSKQFWQCRERGKEWQREAEHSCTLQNLSILICQTKPVFKKDNKRCNRTTSNPCLWAARGSLTMHSSNR